MDPIALANAMHRLPEPSGQRGLSLIELMISMAISLILLMGLTMLIVQQNSSRNELEKTSRQIENGRYAVQLLHDDIEHAGYYQMYYSPPAPVAVMPDPCLTTPLTGTGSLDEAMSLHIQGYDNALPPASGSFSCAAYGLVAANYKPGTDILVIRRADTTFLNPPFTAPAPAPGVIYLQSNTSSHVLAAGPATASFTLAFNTKSNTNVASISPYLVHIYFISPCSVPANGNTCQVAANGTGPDDNGRPIPTLKRLELSVTGGATSFSAPIPLVEGIEDMQLSYGIDNDGDGYPDNSYGTFPASTTDWYNVMNVSINVLAQNTECTVGFTDTKTYNLGAGPVAASTVAATVAPCNNGDYKRHVFSQVVRAINPSGRRAQE